MTTRCTARAKSTAEQCRQAAVNGATVCRFHGGGAPQVRSAAERRIVQAQARVLSERFDIGRGEPVLDPLPELARVAGEIVRLKDGLATQLADLDAAAVATSPLTRATEKALERCADVLGAMAKLGFTATSYRMNRATADEIIRTVRAAVVAGGGDADAAESFLTTRLEQLADDERNDLAR